MSVPLRNKKRTRAIDASDSTNSVKSARLAELHQSPWQCSTRTSSETKENLSIVAVHAARAIITARNAIEGRTNLSRLFNKDNCYSTINRIQSGYGRLHNRIWMQAANVTTLTEIVDAWKEDEQFRTMVVTALARIQDDVQRAKEFTRDREQYHAGFLFLSNCGIPDDVLDAVLGPYLTEWSISAKYPLLRPSNHAVTMMQTCVQDMLRWCDECGEK